MKRSTNELFISRERSVTQFEVGDTVCWRESPFNNVVHRSFIFYKLIFSENCSSSVTNRMRYFMLGPTAFNTTFNTNGELKSTRIVLIEKKNIIFQEIALSKDDLRDYAWA